MDRTGVLFFVRLVVAATVAQSGRGLRLLGGVKHHPSFFGQQQRTSRVSRRVAGGDVIETLEKEFWSTLNETERRIEAKTRAGVLYLRTGQVDDAVAALDEARALAAGGTDTRWLFSRGVALFYSRRYEEAAADLRAHAAKYERRFEEPATEERLLAVAADRLGGAPLSTEETAAPGRLLGLDVVDARDDDGGLVETRPVFRVVSDLFRGRAAPTDLLAFAKDDADDGPRGDGGTPPDPLRRTYYAHFYAGLYWEAVRGDVARAFAHMTLADRRARRELDKGHATAGADLTLELPRLHLASRDWAAARGGPPPDADLGRARQFQ